MAREDLREQLVPAWILSVRRVGRRDVDEPRAARAPAVLGLHRDEARLFENAKVRANGVRVEAHVLGELRCIERPLRGTQRLEDAHAAAVAERPMEPRLVGGCVLGGCCCCTGMSRFDFI